MLLTGAGWAQERPLWELGMGVTSLNLPYYRGSDDELSYLLPYPYIIYRGEYLSVDKDGVRGWLYRSEHLNLDLSLAAGAPVPSDDSGPRAGMAKLDLTVEFGPSLDYRFWQSQDHRRSAWLRLPLRSAFALGRPITQQGWIFAPYLEFSRHDFGRSGWINSLSLGPLFADAAYHDYIYGVAPQYATASRPAYEAHGGYSGSRLTLMSGKSFKQLMLTAFVRLDTLNGATFVDSPLVETQRYYIAGVALTWIFTRSETLVHAP
jgi:outer membrane scaffolding protein for murein synthesis (MipA/OmpV family)